MILLPKEHGAYGQLALPLVTALSAAGVSIPGLLLAASAVAAFLAHESGAILLGLRGTRARRELGATASWWLACCVTIGIVTGAAALVSMDRDARWLIGVPIVPAVLLAYATARGREKSWYGEVAAALAFAGLSVPVAMAAGAPLDTAAAVAIPFGLLFVTSTLAVRTVILRSRGGGNFAAAAASQRSVFAVAGIGAACLVTFTAIQQLPGSALAAAAPGLLTALAIAARPPKPSRLRAIGWTLVAVSVLTSVVLVATL